MGAIRSIAAVSLLGLAHAVDLIDPLAATHRGLDQAAGSERPRRIRRQRDGGRAPAHANGAEQLVGQRQ